MFTGVFNRNGTRLAIGAEIEPALVFMPPSVRPPECVLNAFDEQQALLQIIWCHRPGYVWKPMRKLLWATYDASLERDVPLASRGHAAHLEFNTHNFVKMSGKRDATIAGAGGPMPDQEGSGASHPTRILIVEDEALVAMDLGFRLEDLGYAVCGTAATADEAVALTETQRPDLILMDVNLHGSRDGVDAAAAIRRTDPAARIIFVTAYSDPSTRDRMAQSGTGVVAKPYTDQALAQAIRHAMTKRSEQ